MNITVHRGTHEIGGTCIEVSSSQGDSIILDLGMPLMGRDGAVLNEEAATHPSISNGILPDICGLYKDQHPSVAAVLLSHPHLDHYGLMDWVHQDIPVYTSRETKSLLEIGNVFYPEALKQDETLNHCKPFEHWKPFKIGTFTVTSYLMDHSAVGASAFLIEADGKRLFYTGDFRGHGRKGFLLEKFVKAPPKNVDCLLLEGTTLGGSHFSGYASEEEVEQGMKQIFSNQADASFITAAGSNIDRLVSIYKAAEASGKTLVIDLYQMHMLQQLKQFAPGLPPHDGDKMRVLYIHGHAEKIATRIGKEELYRYVPRKIDQDEVVARRNEMVLRLPLFRMEGLANAMQVHRPLDNASYVYSMWQGYLDRDSSFRGFCDKYGLYFHAVHTSGHAYLETSKELAEAIGPKLLVPIHTLSGDTFEKHFRDVARLDNGETLSLN